jgi:PKD repeat protein
MKKLFLIFLSILLLVPAVLADSSVEIRPNPATDSDNLNCFIIPNIPGAVFSYTWYKNNVEQSLHSSIITADKTAVGNVWKCVVKYEFAGSSYLRNLGSDTITIMADASSNTAPTAEIRDPANSDKFYTNEKISFWGVATDAEDGLLTGGMLKWYSDNTYFGSGNEFEKDASTLGVGTHTITLIATDSKGLEDTATISIEVRGLPAPIEGAVQLIPDPAYDSNNLVCEVSGNLGGAVIYYSWFKNGIQQTFSDNTVSHENTAVSDVWKCVVKYEFAGTGFVRNLGDDSVTISNRAPVADFTYTADYLGVSFTSTSADPDESDRITSYSWNFGDGAASTLQNPTHTYAAAGTYTVVLTVTDSHLGTGRATKQITVSGKIIVLQSIDVTPNNEAISYLGTLQYTATGHYSDGTSYAITGDATWSSSNTAVATISSRWLTSTGGLASGVSPGQTTITATLGGISGSTTLYVINEDPTAIITLPADNAIFNTGSTITFEGSASDTEDGVLSGNSLVWTSSIDGNIGTGITFSRTLSQGTHTITLTATDSMSGIDTATRTITVNTVIPPIVDTDGDGVPDATDNCPLTPNPNQNDADGDGRGDACDNCPAVSNPNQADADNDGTGDVCEAVVPPVNHAPVLNPIGNRQTDENQQLTFTISAADADNDALTYSAAGLPAGASFNPATRTFAWIPTNQQSGSYSVTFTVSDSQLTDSETITITVGNVPAAPRIDSVSATTPVIVGEDLTISARVTEGDASISGVWVVLWKGQLAVESFNLKQISGNSWGTTFEVNDDMQGVTSFTVYAIDSNGVEARPVTELVEINEAEQDLYIGRIVYDEYPKEGSELWFDITVKNPEEIDLENLKLAINIQDLGIRTTKTFDLDSGNKVTKSMMVELPEGVTGQFDVRIALSNDDIYRVKYRLITVI